MERFAKAELPNHVCGHKHPPLKNVNGFPGLHLPLHPFQGEIDLGFYGRMHLLEGTLRHGVGEKSSVTAMLRDINDIEDVGHPNRRQPLVKLRLDVCLFDIVNLLGCVEVANVDFVGRESDNGPCRQR